MIFRFIVASRKNRKRNLERRTKKFVEKKKWLGRNIQITQDIQICIAAIAIKLTFGLDNYLLPLFKTIIVFPREYYSPFTQTKNKGETNPRGAMVFSWNYIRHGHKEMTDNLNLGLHEFAHALVIQKRYNYRFGNLNNRNNEMSFWRLLKNQDSFIEHFNEWNQMLLRGGVEVLVQKKLFRNYAFTNHMEMFAVATEHFFESPLEIKEQLPEVYEQLRKIYNLEGENLSCLLNINNY